MLFNSEKKSPIIDDKIRKAKEFPITNLYTYPTKKTGKVLMGKCPFHEETRGSFAIYPNTNTYYCFGGCGGGDVIDFYQKLKNCSFQTAVEELSK
ncbi:MAG TPA: CHC2 zinc finger domain-containing protein [bacterium]|nr:CHC2 zinc finger domain-containing protein [bacterium]